MAATTKGQPSPDSFDVRILRQDGPGQPSYWERHRITYERDLNVISVLQKIAIQAKTAEGKPVAPVVWECNCLEEVCGACSMLINGRVRQACSALVDNLLKVRPGEIELQPMSKYPVLRDLMVDRSRLFRALMKTHCWIDVDGYYDIGPGPSQTQQDQERCYPLSQCMSCGCCTEACPQFVQIDVARLDGESDEEFTRRKYEAYDRSFVGPHTIGQTVLFNAHPTGQRSADSRLAALTAEGGVQVCGNAQNCEAVCPKEIPLTTSIAMAGRAATWFGIRKWFDQ